MCYLSDRKEAFNCNVGEFHASRVKVQCEYSLLYLFVIFPRYTVFLSSTCITSCKVSTAPICVEVWQAGHPVWGPCPESAELTFMWDTPLSQMRLWQAICWHTVTLLWRMLLRQFRLRCFKFSLHSLNDVCKMNVKCLCICMFYLWNYRMNFDHIFIWQQKKWRKFNFGLQLSNKNTSVHDMFYLLFLWVRNMLLHVRTTHTEEFCT